MFSFWPKKTKSIKMPWIEMLASDLLLICHFIEKQGLFILGPKECREIHLSVPSVQECQILLYSESGLLFLSQGPLSLLGDYLYKARETLRLFHRRLWLNVFTTKYGTVHELASGSVERIQQEILSCIFNERRVLYAQVRLPSAAS